MFLFDKMLFTRDKLLFRRDERSALSLQLVSWKCTNFKVNLAEMLQKLIFRQQLYGWQILQSSIFIIEQDLNYFPFFSLLGTK